MLENKMIEIKESIAFLKNWIYIDLKELQNDTTSDYAKFILSGHKHINIAIHELEGLLDTHTKVGD